MSAVALIHIDAVLLDQFLQAASVSLTSGDELPVVVRAATEGPQYEGGFAGAAVGDFQLVEWSSLGVQQPNTGVGEAGQIGRGVGDRVDRGDDDETVSARR